jgi:multicomponent Na+:H+ antiporter subunit D
VKASLFLIGGVAMRLNGTDDLDRMGNLWKHTPWLGVLFLFQALSLAGLPPLSGFWGKYLIVVVGVEQRQYWLVGASLLASVLTLFSMVKIWNGAFWAASGTPVNTTGWRWRGMTAVVAALTGISLVIGFGAEAFIRLATQAADQALDQQGYAQAVLGYPGKTDGGATP